MYYLPWETFFFIGFLIVSNSTYEASYARVILWFGFWMMAHQFSICFFQILFTIFTCRRNNSFQRLSTAVLKNGASSPRVSNFKRLLRSQIYCMVATSIGAYLLITEYHSWPSSLLTHWTPLCVPAFEMALGHWMFSLYEDYMSNDEVSAHITPMPGETKLRLFTNYYAGLAYHHLFTILAYAWSLWTHNLAGLCVFGLLFEAPVVVLNVREIIVAFDKEVQFPFHKCSKWMFQLYGNLLFGLFHLCRTLFCALYPLSLVIWRNQLFSLPWGSHLMYHLFGLLFCGVNAILYGSFFTRYLLEDGVRAGLISERSLWQYFRVKDQYLKSADAAADPNYDLEQQSSADAIVPELSASDGVVPIQSIGLDDRNENEYKKPSVSVKPSTPVVKVAKISSVDNASTATVSSLNTHDLKEKLITAQELSLHMETDHLWVAVNGYVYDVTAFQHKHPGGAQVLLQVAGKDASAQFLEVGHSQGARRSMEKYKIGRLVSATTGTAHIHTVGGAAYNDDDMNAKSTSADATSTVAWTRHPSIDKEYLGPWYTEDGPYDSFKTYMAGRDLYFPATVTFLACVIFLVGGNRVLYEIINSSNTPATTVLTSTNGAFSASSEVLIAEKVSVSEIDPHSYESMTKAAAAVAQLASAHAMMICIATSFSYLILHISRSIFRSAGSSNTAIASFFEYFKLGKIVSVLVTTKVLSTSILLEMILLSLPTYSLSLNAMRISLMLSYSIETLLRKRSVVNRIVLFLFAANIVDLWGLGTVLYKSHASIAVLVLATVVCASMSRLVCMRTVQDTSTLIPAGMIALLLLWHLREWFVELCDRKDVLDPLYTANFAASLSSSQVPLMDGFQSVISVVPGYPMLYFPPLLLVYLLWPWIYKYFLALMEFSTIHFASQFILVVSGGFLWSLSGAVGPARWWSFVLSFYGLSQVSYECGMTLQSAGASAPRHLFRSKQIEDSFRSLIAAQLAGFIIKTLIEIVNLILPLKYKYYLYPTPVFDFGESVDYGVAFQVNGDPQQQPTVFQHNVGHFGSGDYDHIRTGTATRDMMWELINDPDAGKKGFVADTVAIFPLESGGARPLAPGADVMDFLRSIVNPAADKEGRTSRYKLREINLSAWSSEKAAYDWYKNSAAHKKIVKEYHNGDLQEFSAMLATLVPPPSRPIRWETRCRSCHKMTGNDPGHNVCPHCGAVEKFPLPYL